MANCLRALLPLILAFSAASAQPLVNVDCGTSVDTVGYLGKKWVGDERYVSSGQSAVVKINNSLIAPLTTLRYFPSRKKNCYSFPGVGTGNKILVRAWFYYGNYDGLSSPPTFNLLFDENFWTTVITDMSSDQMYEMIYITKADDVSICLARTSLSDVPFINSLEIKKLDQGMYNGMDTDRPLSLTVRYAKASAVNVSDLHNNSLSGSIPEFLGHLPNLNKRLADNQFNGSLPASPTINSTVNVNISGNNISEPNLTANRTEKNNTEKNSTEKKTNVGVMAEATIGSLFFLLLLVMIVIFLSKKRSGNTVRSNPSGDKAKQTSILLEPNIKHGFSHAEIVEITKNFEKVIGKGGSGNVYYGQLQDGREVAVKVLRNLLSQGTKEFVAEAMLLMTVHHRCLVSFVGYCEEGGNLILLYEYMSGGNLRQLLSGRSSTSAFLTWEIRLQIALRVATGLDYLHSGCYPPIIHRDVKTTNILLNGKMEAKVADFGLSKAGQKDDVAQLSPTVASTPRHFGPEHVLSCYGQKDDVTQLSTAVAGTPGYIDPEYYGSNRVTQKSDVYSFGVVILELITGRPPIFAESGEPLHIVQWVTPKLARGDIHSVADPKLGGQYDVNSMWKVADIAMSCTSETSNVRPHMVDVVNQLKEALEAEFHSQQRIDTPSLEIQHSPSSYEFGCSSLPSLHLPPPR